MPDGLKKQELASAEILARMDRAFEDVKAEMKRLKLDRGKAADRRPLDLLEAAYLAIRYPASVQGAAWSALLTLRGSIDYSIEELFRKCPVQAKAGNRRDRVLAIGLHGGKSGLALAHFDSLAAAAEVLNRELSGKGIQATLERPDLMEPFTRGAEFLRTLLGSVDDALLRP